MTILNLTANKAIDIIDMNRNFIVKKLVKKFKTEPKPEPETFTIPKEELLDLSVRVTEAERILTHALIQMDQETYDFIEDIVIPKGSKWSTIRD